MNLKISNRNNLSGEDKNEGLLVVLGRREQKGRRRTGAFWKGGNGSGCAFS